MCGRFTQRKSPRTIAKAFKLDDLPLFAPRYNIAPTQPIATVIRTSHDNNRHFRLFKWGLIPSWAKDPSIGNGMINARSETAATKPSFRSAFKRRRCLVIADGFYEWQQQEKGKQPYFIHMKDDRPFTFAGLWEHWQDPNGNEVDSCTILTTQANSLMEPIHDRMPVILPPNRYDLWLDPDVQRPVEVSPLLRPYDQDDMMAYPVSKLVNKPANDAPDCVHALGAKI